MTSCHYAARDEESAQEQPTTIAEVMSVRHRPGEDIGQRSSVVCELPQTHWWQIQPSLCLLALQGCSPRASIREHRVCISAPIPLWAMAMLPTEPLHVPTGTMVLLQIQQVHKLITAMLSPETPRHQGYVTSRLTALDMHCLFFSGLFEISLLCAILICS